MEKLKESTVLQGRYTIKRILGEGGYGIVYLAYDNQNKVDCAIKEFSPSRIEVYKEGPQGTQPVELSESQKQKYYNDSLDNFKREIQILKKLKGFPGVVAYKDSFETNNTLYICMELLKGNTLAQIVKTRNSSLSQITNIILPVAAIMDNIHEKAKVIHRDLTPENIFVMDDGTVKIIDFGSAIVFDDERVPVRAEVKVNYSPLEQFQIDSSQGRATDIYSLAAAYYYAITKIKLPSALDREKGSSYKPLYQLCPKAGSNLSKVLDKALNIYIQDRKQTMKSFSSQIISAVNSSSVYQRKVLYFREIRGGIPRRTLEFWADQHVLIGRAPENHIVINDANYSTSRKHCKVTYDEIKNRLFVYDYSENGTFINNQKIGKDMYRAIEASSPVRITLANKMFEFQIGVK